MNTDRVSILLGPKNSRYIVTDRAVRIIKDKFNDGFSINDLTSLDAFSPEEKECLRNMFSTNISILYSWEHSFQYYFRDNLWHYNEFGYDYRSTMKFILLLLNINTTLIGKTVYTDDNRLIESLYHSWNKLYDEELQRIVQESRLYEVKSDTLQFISSALKTRVGDSCEFNFEFVKAFAESLSDYDQKLIYEAVTGYP